MASICANLCIIVVKKCNRVQGKVWLQFNDAIHLCYFGIEFQRIFKC